MTYNSAEELKKMISALKNVKESYNKDVALARELVQSYDLMVHQTREANNQLNLNN